jgi:hypothetical protein
MKTTYALFVLPFLALGLFAGLGACNSGTGNCPAKETIQPGASCDDEHLQCAYDLATPAPACDGTSTTISSSCTCTNGTWACPDPVACEAGAPTDDAEPDAATE